MIKAAEKYSIANVQSHSIDAMVDAQEQQTQSMYVFHLFPHSSSPSCILITFTGDSSLLLKALSKAVIIGRWPLLWEGGLFCLSDFTDLIFRRSSSGAEEIEDHWQLQRG